MPKRKLYTVSTPEGGGWEATESGDGVIVSGDRKPEVVRAAARVARQQDSASLRIQRRDGQIQEERTSTRI